MILLLSPAKNMDFSKGPIQLPHTVPFFIDDANYLSDKMKKLSARQIGKLMKISQELADLNFQRFNTWNDSDNNRREAIFAFNGEVYRGLNSSEFSTQDLNFAQEHLLILSGLYGLLRPLDVIQPYRLEMGSKPKITTQKNNLYKFWDSRLTHKLNEVLVSHSSKLILNLASNEYSKAIIKKELTSPIIDFNFLDWKNGEFKSIMTWTKNARGALANQLIKKQINSIDDLKRIEFNGYSFNPTLSDKNAFSFTRKQA